MSNNMRDFQPERSTTPNKLYNSLDEAHRGITARYPASPQPRVEAAEAAEPVPRSPSPLSDDSLPLIMREPSDFDHLDNRYSSDENLEPRRAIGELAEPDKFEIVAEDPVDKVAPKGLNDTQDDNPSNQDNRVGQQAYGVSTPELAILPATVFSPVSQRSPNDNWPLARELTQSVPSARESTYLASGAEPSTPVAAPRKGAPGNVGGLSNQETTHLSGQEGTRYPIAFDDVSSDSDHSCTDINLSEPFPFDKYSFLPQTAEKEVSRALRTATGIATQPSFVEHEHTDNAKKKKASIPRSAPFLPPPPGKLLNRSREVSEKRHRKPQDDANFYIDSAIKDSWQTEDNGIRVPTSPPPLQTGRSLLPSSSRSPATHNWSPIGGASAGPSGALVPEQASGLSTARDVERDEWETLPDDQNGSNTFGTRNQAIGKVIAGSSVADVSDADFATADNNVTQPSNVYYPEPGARPYALQPPEQFHYVQDPSAHFDAAHPVSYEQNAPSSGSAFDRTSAFMRAGQRNLNRFSNFVTGRNRGGDNQQEVEMKDLGGDALLPENDHVTTAPAGGHHPLIDPRSAPQQQQVQVPETVNTSGELGRPLRGWNFKFDVISLTDAQSIQGVRRILNIEDQSESGNFVSYHPMSSRASRESRRFTAQSAASRAGRALNSGPSGYVPLDPSTGHMLRFPSNARLSENRPRGATTCSVASALGPVQPLRNPYGNPFLSESEQRLTNRPDSSRFGVSQFPQSARVPYLTPRPPGLRRPSRLTGPRTLSQQGSTDPELGALAGRLYRRPRPIYCGERVVSVSQYSVSTQYRLRAFFWATVLSTVILPPSGIIAAAGILDSAIS